RLRLGWTLEAQAKQRRNSYSVPYSQGLPFDVALQRGDAMDLRLPMQVAPSVSRLSPAWAMQPPQAASAASHTYGSSPSFALAGRDLARASDGAHAAPPSSDLASSAEGTGIRRKIIKMMSLQRPKQRAGSAQQRSGMQDSDEDDVEDVRGSGAPVGQWNPGAASGPSPTELRMMGANTSVSFKKSTMKQGVLRPLSTLPPFVPRLFIEDITLNHDKYRGFDAAGRDLTAASKTLQPSIIELQASQPVASSAYRVRLLAWSAYMSPTVRWHARNAVTLTSVRTDAAVMIADVTGFTKLTEILSKKGTSGVELLTTCMNNYFTRAINMIMAYEGDVVKFAGDSMIVLFYPNEFERRHADKGLRACTLRMMSCSHQLASKLGHMRMKMNGQVEPAPPPPATPELQAPQPPQPVPFSAPVPSAPPNAGLAYGQSGELEQAEGGGPHEMVRNNSGPVSGVLAGQRRMGRDSPRSSTANHPVLGGGGGGGEEGSPSTTGTSARTHDTGDASPAMASRKRGKSWSLVATILKGARSKRAEAHGAQGHGSPAAATSSGPSRGSFDRGEARPGSRLSARERAKTETGLGLALRGSVGGGGSVAGTEGSIGGGGGSSHAAGLWAGGESGMVRRELSVATKLNLPPPLRPMQQQQQQRASLTLSPLNVSSSATQGAPASAPLPAKMYPGSGGALNGLARNSGVLAASGSPRSFTEQAAPSGGSFRRAPLGGRSERRMTGGPATASSGAAGDWRSKFQNLGTAILHSPSSGRLEEDPMAAQRSRLSESTRAVRWDTVQEEDGTMEEEGVHAEEEHEEDASYPPMQADAAGAQPMQYSRSGPNPAGADASSPAVSASDRSYSPTGSQSAGAPRAGQAVDLRKKLLLRASHSEREDAQGRRSMGGVPREEGMANGPGPIAEAFEDPSHGRSRGGTSDLEALQGGGGAGGAGGGDGKQGSFMTKVVTWFSANARSRTNAAFVDSFSNMGPQQPSSGQPGGAHELPSDPQASQPPSGPASASNSFNYTTGLASGIARVPPPNMGAGSGPLGKGPRGDPIMDEVSNSRLSLKAQGRMSHTSVRTSATSHTTNLRNSDINSGLGSSTLPQPAEAAEDLAALQALRATSSATRDQGVAGSALGAGAGGGPAPGNRSMGNSLNGSSDRPTNGSSGPSQQQQQQPALAPNSDRLAGDGSSTERPYSGAGNAPPGAAAAGQPAPPPLSAAAAVAVAQLPPRLRHEFVNQPDAVQRRIAGLLRMHVLGSVRVRVEAGHLDFINEIRPLTCMFLGFPSLLQPRDDVSHRDQVQCVQFAYTGVQAVMRKWDGSFLQFRSDEKGFVGICAFGLPGHTHEDNPARGVRAALELASTVKAGGHRVSIGVTTGDLLCTCVGARKLRSEYTVFGDAINLSARLMVKCKNDASMGEILCDEPTYLRAKYQASFIELEPLPVKGKAQPVLVYRVGAHDATAEAQAAQQRREAAEVSSGERPLIGRDAEMTLTLNHAASMISGMSNGGIIVIEGNTGMGKTKLLMEVRKSLERINADTSISSRPAFHMVFGMADTANKSQKLHPWRRVFQELFALDLKLKGLGSMSISPTASIGGASPAHSGHRRALANTSASGAHAAAAQGRRRGTEDGPGHAVFTALGERLYKVPNYDTEWRQHLAELLDLPLASIPLGSQEAEHAQHPQLSHDPREAALGASLPAGSVLKAPAPWKAASTRHMSLTLQSGTPALLDADAHPGSININITAATGAVASPSQAQAVVAHGPAHGNQVGAPIRKNSLNFLVHVMQEFISLYGPTLALLENLHDFDTWSWQLLVKAAEVIIERMDRLKPGIHLTLKVASVMGQWVDLDILHKFYPINKSKEELRAHLQELERGNFLKPTDAEGVWEFNMVERDIVYEVIPHYQRRRMHAKLAQELEKSLEEQHVATLTTIAYHWNQACMGHEVTEVECSLKAIEFCGGEEEEEEEDMDGARRLFPHRAAEAAYSGSSLMEALKLYQKAAQIAEILAESMGGSVSGAGEQHAMAKSRDRHGDGANPATSAPDGEGGAAGTSNDGRIDGTDQSFTAVGSAFKGQLNWALISRLCRSQWEKSMASCCLGIVLQHRYEFNTQLEYWDTEDYFRLLTEHAIRGLMLLGAPHPKELLSEKGAPTSALLGRICCCLYPGGGSKLPAPGPQHGWHSGLVLQDSEVQEIRDILLVLIIAAEHYSLQHDGGEYTRLLTFCKRVCKFFNKCSDSGTDPFLDIRSACSSRIKNYKASRAMQSHLEFGISQEPALEAAAARNAAGVLGSGAVLGLQRQGTAPRA
ncbi:Adenylate cyclase type 10, partial [Tetrabaena socialis]